MSAKKSSIIVQGAEITISSINQQDYISLTDMVRETEGEDHIRNWMRNKNTIEFLGVWEQIHNPNFKGAGFDTFLQEAGLNRFNMTPRKWIDGTNAIGIISKAGRNGGTLAHKDIAFEFGAWISPIFKLYLITEYQRLKEQENNLIGLEWNVKRILSKANYTLHTDAIKEHIIPFKSPYEKEEWIYANEADMLNLIIFGCTAKQWRDNHTRFASKGQNLRDSATIHELTVLSNLESLNATLIAKGVDKKSRYEFLRSVAQDQLNRLRNYSFVPKIDNLPQSIIAERPQSSFNNKLNQALNYDPKKDKRNTNEGAE